MEAIKETLQGLLKDLKVRKATASASNPERLLKKVFSPKEAEHAQPGAIKNGVLYLQVDSSTWLYYFNLHKKELLEKFAGQNSQIKELRFNLGQIQRSGDKKKSCMK
jgi:predicted nucleic acid-binding Zn ribbon protein